MFLLQQAKSFRGLLRGGGNRSRRSKQTAPSGSSRRTARSRKSRVTFAPAATVREATQLIPRPISSSAYSRSEVTFAAGLFNPAAKIATRWPSWVPNQTATSQLRGTLTIPASPAGHLVLQLFPLNPSNILGYYNVSPSPTTPLSSWGAVANTVTNTVYANSAAGSIRVVSAELTLYDSNPAINKQGTVLVGSLPYNLYNNSSFTYDALKDNPYTYQEVSGSRAQKGIALPMSPSCASLVASQSDWCFPVIALMGGIAGANYTIGYHVNYEYVPIPSMTDLLEPGASDGGSESSVGPLMSKLMRSGLRSAVERATTNIPGIISQLVPGPAGKVLEIAGPMLLASQRKNTVAV